MATPHDGARTLQPHAVPAADAWRHAIGRLLRRRRERLGLRLVDVAARAGVSPQYLSEVERGRKEPSSEVLAAVTAALGLTLVDLANGLGRALEPRRLTSVPSGYARAGGATQLRSGVGDAVLLAA